jgi:repressor LexA
MSIGKILCYGTRMFGADPRQRLAALAAQRGVSLAACSRLIGRSHAYLQQWIARGSPRVLAERDRRVLADFLGVDEAALGGPPARARPWRAPRLDVAASAGTGAVNDGEAALGASVVTPELAGSLGLREGCAAVIRVRGDSMAPGLVDGDELLVDEGATTPDAAGGIYVVRIDGALLVKRVRRGEERLQVSSDNPDAPPVPEGEVTVVGRVVWQGRVVR